MITTILNLASAFHWPRIFFSLLFSVSLLLYVVRSKILSAKLKHFYKTTISFVFGCIYSIVTLYFQFAYSTCSGCSFIENIHFLTDKTHSMQFAMIWKEIQFRWHSAASYTIMMKQCA